MKKTQTKRELILGLAAIGVLAVLVAAMVAVAVLKRANRENLHTMASEMQLPTCEARAMSVARACAHVAKASGASPCSAVVIICGEDEEIADRYEVYQ